MMEMKIVQHAIPAAMDIGVNCIVLMNVEIMFAPKIRDHVHKDVYPASIRIQMTHAVGAPLDVFSAPVQVHVLRVQSLITGAQHVNKHVTTVQIVANLTAVLPAVMMDITCNTTIRTWAMNVNGVNRGLVLQSVDKDTGEPRAKPRAQSVVVRVHQTHHVQIVNQGIGEVIVKTLVLDA